MVKKSLRQQLEESATLIDRLERQITVQQEQHRLREEAIKRDHAVSVAAITAERDLHARYAQTLLDTLSRRVGGGVLLPLHGIVAGCVERGAAVGEPGASEFTVVLKGFGDKKINVIKAVRVLNPALGLKEAKDLVEAAPIVLKERVTRADAEAIARMLSEAGADVELQAPLGEGLTHNRYPGPLTLVPPTGGTDAT